MGGLSKGRWLLSLARAGLPEVVAWIPVRPCGVHYDAHAWATRANQALGAGNYSIGRRKGCLRITIGKKRAA